MTYDQLNHYAYDLVGKMKRTLHKKSNDIFVLRELDILTFRWTREESLSTLNVYQLHELLVFIENTMLILIHENKEVPTYRAMRSIFRKELLPGSRK